MTPQEIFEYKLKWKPGVQVATHSDYHAQCKQWCRTNIERHKWSFEQYTGAYEHTFQFERQADANRFIKQFERAVDQ